MNHMNEFPSAPSTKASHPVSASPACDCNILVNAQSVTGDDLLTQHVASACPDTLGLQFRNKKGFMRGGR